MTTADEMFHADAVRALPLRERVGLVIDGTEARKAIKATIDAEKAGVRQVWSTQSPATVDGLTFFAVAATQTSAIRVGTSILPTYPRHPLALAAQVLAFEQIAPGRLRLGIGPSHRPMIEGVYGYEMKNPIAHTREYVAILRSALEEGRVEYQGEFFHVSGSIAGKAHVPILVSALGPGAFKSTGAISDGAISWMAPVPYLLKTALPSLQQAAQEAHRPAPPLVAHVPVALGTDRQAVIAAARQRLGYYGKLPFYAHMFAESGHAVNSDGSMPDDLVESLVVSGDDQTVAAHLKTLLANGLDELLLLSVPVKDAEEEWGRLAHIIGQI